MKKNILLVQSFLVLPLLTSSFIFSMEKEKKTYSQAAKGAQLPPLPQLQPSLKNSNGSIKRERKKQRQQRQSLVLPTESTKTEPVIEYLSPADAADAQQDLAQAKQNINQLKGLADLLHIINTLPAEKELNHVDSIEKSVSEAYYPRQAETDILAQSTLGIQTEARGFAFLGRIANSFTSYKKAVIGFLKNDTFEVDNQDHLAWLDKAIIECDEANDMQSLLFIAQTCEEKYPSIKFSDSSLLFQSLEKKYTQQVQASHQALQGYNQEYTTQYNEQSAALKEQITQLSNTHKALTAQLAQTYEAK